MIGERTYYIILLFILGLLKSGNTEETQPIVLRGWMETNDSVLFSMHDRQSGGSAWVRLEQPFSGGHIVEFSGERSAVLFQTAAGSQWIKMSEPMALNSSIVFEEELSNARKQRGYLKPYHTVPEGVKKMPAKAIVNYLNEAGYEIPYHVLTQARADTINEAIQQSKDQEIGAARPPDGTYLGPRAPAVTTSMSREEKIARGIVGYSHLQN